MRDSETYEPADHRQHLRHPTNYMETLIHFYKACIGTGIMAMPYAFKEVGWVSGLFTTIIIGALCVYMTNRLAISSRRMCILERKPAMSYVDTANASLKYGPEVTKNFKNFGSTANVFLILYQFGSSCIYAVFVSGNLKHVWDYLYPETHYDIRLFMLVMMIPQCVVGLVDNYKHLSYFSLVADICTASGFSLIFVFYLLVDTKELSEISAFKNGVNRFPMFVATVFFSMEAVALVLALENEMKNPKNYSGVFGIVNVAMIPAVTLYTAFGFCGYLKYGDDVKSSATFNLPVGERIAQIILFQMSFAIFITFHLSVFVTYDLIWKTYLGGPDEDNTEPVVVNYYRHYMFRLAVILAANLCAMGIPNLSLFIVLIGALCLSVTGFAFIVMMWVCIFWNEYSGIKFGFFIVYNAILLFLAACVAVFGVGQAIYDIADFYSGEVTFD